MKLAVLVPRIQPCLRTLLPCVGTYVAAGNVVRFRSHLDGSGCRKFSSQTNTPELFEDYEWHRKWMENESRKENLPEYYNFARDVIDRWATLEQTGVRQLSNPALWITNNDGEDRKWSFQDLSSLSKRTANVFIHKCGLDPGDKLILILPRVPEWWFVNVAAIRAGLILSAGTVLLRPNDIKHRVQLSGAKCIVADRLSVDNIDKIADQCPSLKCKVFVGSKSETRPGWLNFEDVLSKASEEFQTVNSRFDDPMTVFFTSGTTGTPKMAEHTHGSYGYGSIITARYFLQCTDKDVVWNMSDTGWAKSAWSSLFAPWLRGSCVFAHNTDKFDPVIALRILEKKPAISVFCAAPTAVRFLVQQPLNQYKQGKLHCVSAGEPVNPELLQEWKSGTGLDLYEGYGQTETTLLCGTYPIMENKPGSMGKAAPGVDLRIVDDDGVELPPNTEGNIGINTNDYRPIGLFSGYVGDPDRTASVFQGGYYLTGDRAKIDEDGYVWFIGRADDVILTSGYRIGPFEVESALIEHPSVLESAVVSSPDPVRGEVVKAFVTLTGDYQTADRNKLTKELQEHVKTVTAPYKYPRKIEFVDQLPKTVSGKIRRVELRNKEWGHEP
ncbi:acyl-coenzyme A synthetase ACSM3, mitochondrial-like [Ylistrum balloti]|uniref:acyl-coenzyme A synthetase ACSM3, mitochondrial-like n=1 Tax=Ylistrum balloti TaxID=509963 RepID=UPI002905813A|nr:acyl-coenzyme A synthetase ACSM3, mitochondrial-like [Ylistrum balloti]